MRQEVRKEGVFKGGKRLSPDAKGSTNGGWVLPDAMS